MTLLTTDARSTAPTGTEPAVRLARVSKRFGDGPNVLDDVDAGRRARRVRLPAGRFRLRQVDAAQPGRRSGLAVRRARSTSPPAGPRSMFQEPALLPVAHRRSERRAGAAPARHRQEGAPRPGRRAARPGAPARRRAEAPARAVRRHAAARRAGPRPGAGDARAAHGRAVRRARRHHPRRAARGARPHPRVAGADRAVRDAQRPRGRPARRPRRAAVQPPRPGRAHYDVGIGHPRRIESPEVASLSVAITSDLHAEVRRHASAA